MSCKIKRPVDQNIFFVKVYDNMCTIQYLHSTYDTYMSGFITCIIFQKSEMCFFAPVEG